MYSIILDSHFQQGTVKFIFHIR